VGELLKEELVDVNVEGKKALILCDDYDQLRNSALEGHTLCLLPNFDPLMLAHVEKNHLVDSCNYKRVYRNQGWISSVILLNGRVIGAWSIQRGAKPWALEIEPFENFSKKIRTRIEEEAASLGRFQETSWEIKFRR
jgi:Winged helix DNA-binding domain